MSKQIIGAGAAPDDGTGDTARAAFIKVNANFTDLYTTFGDGTNLVAALDGADGADGVAGVAGNPGAAGPQGNPGADGVDGADGADGSGATPAEIEAAVTLTGDVTSVGFVTTLANGTVSTSNLVNNAVSGTKLGGNAVSTGKITDGAVTIPKLSASGTPDASTFLRGDDTWSAGGIDGVDGVDGNDGATGADGAAGSNGLNGTDGTDGQGVPAGGSSNQVLSKVNGTDFNTQWVNPTGSGGDVVSDTTPQLGGDLDTNNFQIVGNMSPNTDSTSDLGTATEAWKDLYIDRIFLAGNELSSLSDPGADRIVFWDDSANSTGYLVVGAGLDLTATAVKVDLNTVEAAILTAGVAHTDFDAGTKTGGTFTPDEASGNVQHAINGGSFVIAPMVNSGIVHMQITNNASAGAITFPAFTILDGDTLTTIDGADFFVTMVVNNGFSTATVKALQ